ncbi:MAG: hypothetical protein VKJ24_18880, partial [Synechococcales bacterium]|nr:hypothetical protein [Synechococcales bacterium]
FGAVKESMGTVMTRSGNVTGSIVIGTPGFMPSEQAAGRPVYSSDLYAVGLTAIYMLTGKLPQEIETDPKTGEILWKPYAPRVSPTLASILDKAIHSYAHERYTTAKEMLQALQQKATPGLPRSSFKESSNLSRTVVVAPGHKSFHSEFSPPPSKSGNLSKLAIAASLFLVATVLGVFIADRVTKIAQPPTSTPPPTPTPTLTPTPTPTPIPISKDSTYAQKLLGTWETQHIQDNILFQAEESFYPNQEFSGAAVVTDGEDTLYLRYSGTWKIEDEYLYYKVTSSNNTKLMPIGDLSANRIINITDKDYVYIDSSGKQHVDNRK